MKPLLIIVLILSAIYTHAGEPCQPVVRSIENDNYIDFRPHKNGLMDCTVSRKIFTDLLSRFMQKTGKNKSYKALMLGRLDHYPWLSHHLSLEASRHPDWDAVKGRPKPGTKNGVVIPILTSPAVMKWLQAPFKNTGYKVIDVYVEKVRIKDVTIKSQSLGKVPFDALVTYTLVKK